jgi:hypothetical protein
MKRKLTSAVGVSALVVAFAAAPANAKPTDPPNCHGKIVSELAHTFGGAAKAAEFFGVSVKEGQIIIREICSGGI